MLNFFKKSKFKKLKAIFLTILIFHQKCMMKKLKNNL